MRTCRALLVSGTAVAVLAVGAAACGGGQSAITTGASSQLSQQVSDVRSAASSGNRAEAMAQLVRLQATVATLLAGHQISAQRADEILRAAAAVATELGKLPAPSPTPSPTVDTTPTFSEESSPFVPPGKRKRGGD